MCTSLKIKQRNINILSRPCAVKEELENYSAKLADVLGDYLIGIYVYGSLARNCFNPATSDVDIVVVVAKPCNEKVISEIQRVHQNTNLPIDAAFVTCKQLNVMKFPAPVTFLIKPLSSGKIVRLPEGSPDFLVQRQDVYESGIVLVGPTANKLFRPVPWNLLERYLDLLFPHIVPRFKNSVLMLCRIAYAYSHQKLCSKQEAGEGAIHVFSQQWHPMIEKALDNYSVGINATDESTENLLAFERYCAECIDKLKTDSNL